MYLLLSAKLKTCSQPLEAMVDNMFGVEDHILYVLVLPLVGAGVQCKEPGVPGPVSSLSCLLSLCLFENEFLMCSFVLVLSINGNGYLLPESAKMQVYHHNSHKIVFTCV